MPKSDHHPIADAMMRWSLHRIVASVGVAAVARQIEVWLDEAEFEDDNPNHPVIPDLEDYREIVWEEPS